MTINKDKHSNKHSLERITKELQTKKRYTKKADQWLIDSIKELKQKNDLVSGTDRQE